jgi:hypothetical protein
MRGGTAIESARKVDERQDRYEYAMCANMHGQSLPCQCRLIPAMHFEVLGIIQLSLLRASRRRNKISIIGATNLNSGEQRWRSQRPNASCCLSDGAQILLSQFEIGYIIAIKGS